MTNSEHQKNEFIGKFKQMTFLEFKSDMTECIKNCKKYLVYERSMIYERCYYYELRANQVLITF